MSTPDDAPPQQAFPTTVSDGASGVAVGYAAERIELVLDRAYPPGRPLTFTVALPGGQLRLEGKAVNSKRRDDARYEVRVKLTSLRREDRTALEVALGRE